MKYPSCGKIGWDSIPQTYKKHFNRILHNVKNRPIHVHVLQEEKTESIAHENDGMRIATITPLNIPHTKLTACIYVFISIVHFS